MIKRKRIAAFLLGATIITGLAFNAATTANYTQDLGKATQTINAATWDVKIENNLREHTIFPGGEIGNDTITLTNKNSYSVMFTINLISKDEQDDNVDSGFTKGLDSALTLDLKKDGDSTGITNLSSEKSVKVLVEGVENGSTEKNVTLNSHVIWTPKGEADISYTGSSVSYTYEITAESMPTASNN